MSIDRYHISQYLKDAGWKLSETIKTIAGEIDIFNLHQDEEQYQISVRTKQDESYYQKLIELISQIEDRAVSIVKDEILGKECTTCYSNSSC